jgi:prevent-host-death family protein
MQRVVTAREANQQFARILREVETGAEIIVTRRGRPVARIVAAQTPGERLLTPEQEAAHARSMTRLRKGWDLGGRKFDRDEIYAEFDGEEEGQAEPTTWRLWLMATKRLVPPAHSHDASRTLGCAL